jgi:hypothetical protein
VHRGVIRALNYGKSLRPNHLAAVYVAYDDEDRERMEREWEEFKFDVPLEVVASPYRDLVDPVREYLDDLDDRWHNDTVTVIIPEFVLGKWYSNVLHNQSALALKLSLLFRPNTVVISVPYHLDAEPSHKTEKMGDTGPPENVQAGAESGAGVSRGSFPAS